MRAWRPLLWLEVCHSRSLLFPLSYLSCLPPLKFCLREVETSNKQATSLETISLQINLTALHLSTVEVISRHSKSFLFASELFLELEAIASDATFGAPGLTTRSKGHRYERNKGHRYERSDRMQVGGHS